MQNEDVDTEGELFDPTKADNYARHLAKVNESKTVIATEDILNDQNAILVKAGAQIDARTTERIVKFKLLRPIEESVAIEGDVDGATLRKDMDNLIAQSLNAQRIHQHFKLDSVIKPLCDYYQSFPILRQKITVLSMQLNRVYLQSLFGAWLASAIGCQMRLSDEEQENLFIAAIAHDIGKLHINESVLEKEGALSPEEWRQIYAHPIIGEKILSNIDRIPAAAVCAVREHHERCDGTGYPSGKKGGSLQRYGQIIAMADTAAAVLARMRDEGRGFRDLMPILQINSHAHFEGVYDALILILRKAELGNDGVVPGSDMPAFIDDLIKTDKLLSACYNAVHEPLNALGRDHQDRKLSAIQAVVTNISTGVRGTGILDEGYLRFLDQVKADSLAFAYREIEDVAIMLGELQFQFKRLVRLIRDYLELQPRDQAVADTLKTILENISGIGCLEDAHCAR